MSKFNVGDRVKVVGLSGALDIPGVIVDNECFFPECDELHHAYTVRSDSGVHNCWNENELELVERAPKFKVGDRVRVTDKYPYSPRRGKMATVTAPPTDECPYVRAEIDDDEWESFDGLGLYFLERELEPAPEPRHDWDFKVGDRVRVLDSSEHGWSNHEGEIVGEGTPGYDWKVGFDYGNGSVPAATEVSFHEHELKRLERKEGERFKPGDRVECHADYSFEPADGTVKGYKPYPTPSFTGHHGYYLVEVEGEDSGDAAVDGAWAYYEDELKPVLVCVDELFKPEFTAPTANVYIAPIGTALGAADWKPVGHLAEDTLEAGDREIDVYERSAMRARALDMAIRWTDDGNSYTTAELLEIAQDFADYLLGEDE